MENKKVIIKSNCDHTVGITNAEFQVRRTWEKRGVERAIDFDTLQGLIYEPGIEFLFTNGYLVIDDLEVKKALGLEPEDATEPINIIILTDQQKENLLKNKPMFDFKQVLDDMKYNQVVELAEYAISREITISFEKNEYFMKRIDRNILKSIENMRGFKEK